MFSLYVCTIRVCVCVCASSCAMLGSGEVRKLPALITVETQTCGYSPLCVRGVLQRSLSLWMSLAFCLFHLYVPHSSAASSQSHHLERIHMLSCMLSASDICTEHELVSETASQGRPESKIFKSKIWGIIMPLEDQLQPALHANTLANVCWLNYRKCVAVASKC